MQRRSRAANVTLPPSHRNHSGVTQRGTPAQRDEIISFYGTVFGWEDRPDILEKNFHSTCPKSMIVTTKLYNPNMKVEILAIPPRRNPDDVCSKWRFSMRTPDDPEYVKNPGEATSKPDRD